MICAESQLTLATRNTRNSRSWPRFAASRSKTSFSNGPWARVNPRTPRSRSWKNYLIAVFGLRRPEPSAAGLYLRYLLRPFAKRPSEMANYELTEAADEDLKAIARSTISKWGAEPGSSLWSVPGCSLRGDRSWKSKDPHLSRAPAGVACVTRQASLRVSFRTGKPLSVDSGGIPRTHGSHDP